MIPKTVSKPQASVPAQVERPRETPVFAPAVDIKEMESEVTVIADMPGIDEKSVHVDLDKNILTIRGTFAVETPADCSLAHREYQSGDYERAFTLGEQIDRAGIQATVRNGVLVLVLPKAKEVEPKRIAVAAG